MLRMMVSRRMKVLTGLALLLALLAGCGGQQATPDVDATVAAAVAQTAAAQPTAAQPTNTPVPTDTPAPTATPVPTSTPPPTSTPSRPWWWDWWKWIND